MYCLVINLMLCYRFFIAGGGGGNSAAASMMSGMGQLHPQQQHSIPSRHQQIPGYQLWNNQMKVCGWYYNKRNVLHNSIASKVVNILNLYSHSCVILRSKMTKNNSLAYYLIIIISGKAGTRGGSSRRGRNPWCGGNICRLYSSKV